MSGFGGRGGGGGFGGQQRRNDDYDEGSEDMFVPADDCGRIIGRGGNKIRDLQDQSGCRIKVLRDDEGNGTRRVELRGSADAMAEARGMINQILEGGDDRDNFSGGRGGGGPPRGGSRGFGGGGGGGGGGGYSSGGGEGAKEVMQIDSSFVGRVIGKGGSRVRELQDETGCRINVSRDGHGAYTDVELIGSGSAIAKARQAIDDITSQVY
ncbi:far upstream element-binding protein 2-like [Littorina saxatilis]|uniref:K Homology domain-containing protein n=1 Tax=Littorina saxatilis TaxID=31220 RepID=A0AAN9G9Q7_9CAEN